MASRRSPKRTASEIDLEIEAIAGQGDGRASGPDGRSVFVPLTVPGDAVRARLAQPQAGLVSAQVVELLRPGPGRREPPCRHFGPCGGCRLQHLDPALYAEWKHDRVKTAVVRAGYDIAAIGPLRPATPRSRRRVELAAIRLRERVVLGFRQRASHRIVDVRDCVVASPAINGALGPLRDLLAAVLHPGPPAEVAVTETERGLDILIAWDRAPDLAALRSLAEAIHAAGFARLSWSAPDCGTIPIAVRHEPCVSFAGVAVALPAGAFLQPTVEGERHLVEAVIGGLPRDASAVADLFSGCGTFTFPLARYARVHAIEIDGPALAALEQAARHGCLWGRVTTARRNLEQSPLTPAELDRFDAVLFDPPRSGARRQAEQLAQSAVPTVLAVSCNPASFARDARLLRDGGYRLEAVVPVDQFLWSPHVELAAVFRRA
jgi:23S rRNA (uracil1939-C5)-methyltransferase